MSCVVQYPTASLVAGTHQILVSRLPDGMYPMTQGTGTLTAGAAKPSVGIAVPAQTVAALSTMVAVTAVGTFQTGVFPTGRR